ncbi:MAG: hypothetical protein Q8K82_07380, partial [Gemmatimonadaceae bacterium]|nr:hypothetical protein [Gemmatimonadaceae bacterium]
AGAVGVVHGSHVPVSLDTGSDAVLRIAWSARPERVETCRTLSDSELEALPEHMRQRTVCEGASARYHLEVRRDERVIATAELRGGGLRGDRQLYVFRELAIPSGTSDIAVRLVRLDSTISPDSTDADAEDRPDDATRRTARGRPDADGSRSRRLADMVPARLELRERVTLAPREVLLVTYDTDSRRLRSVRSSP